MMVKYLLLILTAVVIGDSVTAKDTTRLKGESVMKIENQVVEASCGECQFGLAGAGCDLAIQVDGKAYFVDGTHIDDHGDAHADDGFCETVRLARVSGEIRDGRFQSESFRVLPHTADSTGSEKR